MGIGASVAAIALGAMVIEKHFTLRRADGGVDSAFSMEPAEMTSLVVETERAFLALGKPFLGIQEAEKQNTKYKRSLYIVEDVKKGEVFTKDNVKSKRPAFGLHTRNFEHVVGKKAAKDIVKGTPLQSDFIED